MTSGQWPVGSGHWTVGSEMWQLAVASGQVGDLKTYIYVASHWPLAPSQKEPIFLTLTIFVFTLYTRKLPTLPIRLAGLE